METTETMQTMETNNTQPTVLIGVTGCIAAYKTCEIVRQLQKAGVRVKVVMTEHATEFVGPTTFRALTHEPVAVDLFDEAGAPVHHVSLAQECDLFLIAPCTANVLAKLANGVADDLLTTTAVACEAPLLVAPAMNVHMFEDATTQENLRILAERGVQIIEPKVGWLACGETGKGALESVEVIVAATLCALGLKRDMEDISVLITAGPTVEPIDSVRYISNHSSGKMGYAIAKAAIQRGAKVTLVSGPVSLEPVDGAKMVYVNTACEMLDACEANFADSDIAICCAAVADMRPAHPADRKLKKGTDDAQLTTIELVENPDILATLGAKKRADQIVVGFAAETDDLVANGQAKLARKNADMIVANLVGNGKGFGTDTNEGLLITAKSQVALPQMSKLKFAHAIFDAINSLEA